MTNADSRFIEVTDVDGVAVVRFHDLNVAISGREMDRIDNLERELFSVVEQRPMAVILDFDGMDFIPVGDLESALIKLHWRLGSRLQLCNLPATLIKRFNWNQLALMFQIYTGFEDAFAAVDTTPFLVLTTGQQVPLNGDRLLVGRIPYDEEKHRTVLDIVKEEARCQGERIYLPDPHVSKQHAILTRINDDEYAIEDAGSRSGTFVNDQAITDRTTLKIGDTIMVGQLKIGYCDAIIREPEVPWEHLGSD